MVKKILMIDDDAELCQEISDILRLLEEQGLLGEVSGVLSKPFDIHAMLGKIKSSTG